MKHLFFWFPGVIAALISGYGLSAVPPLGQSAGQMQCPYNVLLPTPSPGAVPVENENMG